MWCCAGVSDNRLQNVVITLDKVKLCLERPGEIISLKHAMQNCQILVMLTLEECG